MTDNRMSGSACCTLHGFSLNITYEICINVSVKYRYGSIAAACSHTHAHCTVAHYVIILTTKSKSEYDIWSLPVTPWKHLLCWTTPGKLYCMFPWIQNRCQYICSHRATYMWTIHCFQMSDDRPTHTLDWLWPNDCQMQPSVADKIRHTGLNSVCQHLYVGGNSFCQVHIVYGFCTECRPIVSYIKLNLSLWSFASFRWCERFKTSEGTWFKMIKKQFKIVTV